MNEISRLEQKIEELDRQIRDLRTSLNQVSTGRYVRGGHIYSPSGRVNTLRLAAVVAAPSYVDGYAIIYFLSDGVGVDQLRVCGKIGAEEEDVLLAEISP